MWKTAVAGSFLLCSVSGLASGQDAERADTTIISNVEPFPSSVVDDGRKAVIGTEGIIDDESGEFFSHVTSVVMLDGGHVAVADGATGEVRLFGPSGVLQASTPGMGDGPGEFRWLDWLAECREGQLDAYDPILGRITTFSSVDLTVLDTRRLQSSVGGLSPSTIRCFQGGWIGGTRHLQAPPSSPGPVQWPMSVEIYDSSGQVTIVTRMPGDERYFDGGSLGPLALGSEIVFSASHTNIVAGTQSEPEFAVYGPTGDLSHLVRWDVSDLPITDHDVEAYVDQRRAQTNQDRAVLRRYFSDYPFPEHYPAFGNMLFDDSGHLWIEASQRLGTTENKWWVFSPSGHVVRTISFPNGFRPMDISPNSEQVAGVYMDSLSIELVWILDAPGIWR